MSYDDLNIIWKNPPFAEFTNCGVIFYGEVSVMHLNHKFFHIPKDVC